MITAQQIAWAAGFIEGEGTFSHGRTRLYMAASQVQREPLERLHAWFGGTLRQYGSQHQKGQPYWRWVICGPHMVGLAMTLFPFLSPRRRMAAHGLLECWKAKPGRRNKLNPNPWGKTAGGSVRRKESV